MVKATDMVRVPESEWDRTPEEMRSPYVEQTRKNGYVYAIRVKEDGESKGQLPIQGEYGR